MQSSKGLVYQNGLNKALLIACLGISLFLIKQTCFLSHLKAECPSPHHRHGFQYLLKLKLSTAVSSSFFLLFLFLPLWILLHLCLPALRRYFSSLGFEILIKWLTLHPSHLSGLTHLHFVSPRYTIHVWKWHNRVPSLWLSVSSRAHTPFSCGGVMLINWNQEGKRRKKSWSLAGNETIK